jgi:hypothetical protein
MPLVPAAQKSLTNWLAMIAENDFHDLPSIIAADAVFRSPVGLKPYRRSVRAGTICDS